MPKAVAIALWLISAACFIGSWVTGDRRLVTAGAAALVCYIVAVARRRTRA
jgi:hypothetical protein